MSAASVRYGEGTVGKVYPIVLWATSVMSLLMTIKSLVVYVHMVMLLLLLAIVLLSRLSWERRWARVVSRVLIGLPLAALLLAVTEAIMLACVGESILSAGFGLCLIGIPLVSWILPGAADVAAHRGRYDRWMVRLYSVWMLLMVLADCFSPIRDALVWTWDMDLLRYVWSALAIAQTILCWLCARRLPGEEAPKKQSKKQTRKEKLPQ